MKHNKKNFAFSNSAYLHLMQYTHKLTTSFPQQKIEALHAAVAQGSLREVQALLGRAKLAGSKVVFVIIGSSL